MGSSFGGLTIGISAVFAQQRSLDVTGHNISNVNTPGYSRQVITHTFGVSDTVGRSGNGKLMQIGQGVDVQQIKQYRDEFLEQKLRRETREQGYWETRQASVEELEAIFNDSSVEGFQTVMNNFWNAWQQLSKPTGGLTARAMVKESAIAFIETAQNMDKMLTDFRRSKDNEIQETVDTINTKAKRIAELNMEIKKTEAYGVVANDYRDERNMLINELSKVANIQVHDGDIMSIGLEGRLLVEDNKTQEIVLIPEMANDGYVSMAWKSDGTYITMTGGSLKSMMDSRDVLVKGFRDRMNEFVKALTSEVNAIHKSGYGTKDNVQRPMFLNGLDGTDTNIDLKNIIFNSDLNDFDNIAAAQDPYSNEDNRIANKIADIRTSELFSETTYDKANAKYNPDEFYRRLISDLGDIGQEAATASTSQKLLVDQVEQRMQALSSVSLDEEMSNLIRFEHSYNAAARLVNAMDEMLDHVVNKIGLSGR